MIRIAEECNVSMAGIRPECLLGMQIAADTLERNYGFDLWITSINDGEHKPGSLHPEGLAFDSRKWELNLAERKAFLTECLENMGGASSEWQIMESRLNFHMEWDPK